VNQEVGKCPRNPHGKGHCDHSEHFSNDEGLHLHNRCCWCNRTEVVFLGLPKHGQYAPHDRKHS
jgi:hypothetical protein